MVEARHSDDNKFEAYIPLPDDPRYSALVPARVSSASLSRTTRLALDIRQTSSLRWTLAVG